MTSPLLKPLAMGPIELPNRVLMAPLTRNRAHDDGVPWEKSADYYAQRATAGMIWTEATQIDPMGKGYIQTPGIHTDEQVAGWRKINDAVHAAGGRMCIQLWHVGRISHTSVLPEGRNPVSSTDVAADAQTFTSDGFTDTSKPDALTIDGIHEVIGQFERAARLAKQAGFDAVEVHAANGYLLDQFLQDGVNQRDDAYGGSLENRLRILREAIGAVASHWERGRIGVRLSPLGQAHDMSDSDPEGHFAQIYSALSDEQIAFLHVVENFPGNESDGKLAQTLRKNFSSGLYIANGGYDQDRAEDAIENGHADAVTFGRPFISNPDLPERIRQGADWAEADQDTFYGGDEAGYTDYPKLDDAAAAA
ncbi:alkene reductase [Pseudooctadecabacter sp.]|uniref:alkene reductase n=1 Tax=Pseudooctadecabacter sp. TaxID=1966338 RepID=UPI0025EE4F58|nr:alkene reductase [Pseudooctadecabacter sp.]